MTSSDPDQLSVTVVISVYNEASGIGDCIESLREQSRPPDSIVVVDDGSTDGTLEVLTRLAAQAAHPPLRVFQLPANRGVPSARNHGVSRSDSDIVVFLDADAQAPASWLAELTAPFADPAVAVVGGPDQAPATDPEFSLAVDYSLRSVIGSGRLRQRNPFAPLAPGGCNLAVRRADFEAVGGFDERLDRRGEEKEFLQRLRRKGRRIGYSAGALIWHRRRVNPREFWRQNYLSGKARVDILRLAPDAFAWAHLAPAAVLLVLVLAALTGAAAPVVGAYLAALLLDAVLARGRGLSWAVVRRVPLTDAAIHLGYGAGLWVGALRWLAGGPLGSGAIREQAPRFPAGRRGAPTQD